MPRGRASLPPGCLDAEQAQALEQQLREAQSTLEEYAGQISAAKGAVSESRLAQEQLARDAAAHRKERREGDGAGDEARCVRSKHRRV